MSHLPTLPLLEFLTPPGGWRTEQALISSYSADLAVVVAFILALAGRADDRGSGSGAALARALRDMKGRCRFLVQRGRISEPHRTSTILGLLDRFLIEMPWDEGGSKSVPGRSWHAKIALVRQVSESDAAIPDRWCLWLGSRNLTRDESWDIGLSIEGSADDGASGARIPAIAAVGRRLAQTAGLSAEWEKSLRELSRVHWSVPRGLTIEDLQLMLPDDPPRKRGFPDLPSDASRIVAVAPFLDGKTVTGIVEATTTAKTRQLLSTRTALATLAQLRSRPLANYSLLTLPEPTDAGEETSMSEAGNLDATVDNRGLHAKFVWVEHGRGASLWLGSPNLTDRAWRRNAEAFARVDVEFRGSSTAVKALVEGLEAFIDHARNLNLADLAMAVPGSDVEEVLETARKEVSSRLQATQSRGKDGMVDVRCPEPPHPDRSDVRLEVGRLSGVLIDWPSGMVSVTLPAVQEGRDSELVRIRVSLAGESVSWVQRAPFDPQLGDARDESALRDFLGIRGLLALIADLLSDLPGTGDGPWDLSEDERRSRRQRQVAVVDDLPSLEQVLRTWLREPERVYQAAAILRLAKATPANTDDDPRAAAHLRSLVKSWEVIERFLQKEKAQ